MKLKNLHLFVPITRQEKTADGLIVEGLAFANEDVGDGVNLKRSAMEAASDDYMKWANVREMHMPSAAGKAESIEWTKDGCMMRACIVDKDAIEKCEKGVYKGFSVGVKPEIVRGSDVTKCKWFETSLVDRPADWDCSFQIARAEGLGEAESEVEVEWTHTRGAFAEVAAAAEQNTLFYRAQDWLWGVLWDIQTSKPDNAADLIREACDECAEYLIGVLERGAVPEYTRFEAPDGPYQVDLTQFIARAEFDSATEQISTLTQRVETHVAELGEKEAEITRLAGRVKELEELPASEKRAIRFTDAPALERQILQISDGASTTKQAEALRAEMAEIEERLKNIHDDRERSIGVQRIMVIRSELTRLGA